MKHLITILIILLHPFILYTQSYQGFYSNLTSFYRAESKFWINFGSMGAHNYITGSRVDSIHIDHNDSVFYFHSEISRISGDFYIPDCMLPGPAWIGNKAIIRSGGINVYFNSRNDSIMINTSLSCGDSSRMYTYPSGDFIIAKVSGFDTLTFLGKTDSVKYINLEFYDTSGIRSYSNIDNVSLILSKSHGFIKTINFRDFPDLDQEMPVNEFSLIGIREWNLGFDIPTNYEVHDYNPGEEFHYNNYVTFPPEDVNWISRVLSKQYSPDSTEVSYDFDEIKWGYEYVGDNPDGTPNIQQLSYHDTIQLTIGGLKDYANFYWKFSEDVQNRLLPLEVYQINDINRRKGEIMNYAIYSDRGIYHGRYTIISAGEKYEIAFDHDSCFRYDYHKGYGHKFRTIGCGLGSYFQIQIFYDWVVHSTRLVYYKKGEEEWGHKLDPPVIKNNDNILTGKVLIYPNPSTGLIYLKGLNQEAEITIYDIHGSLVSGYQHFFNHTLDLRYLETGVYIIEVKTLDTIKYERLIIHK